MMPLHEDLVAAQVLVFIIFILLYFLPDLLVMFYYSLYDALARLSRL